jgi:tetratricopeptide (TPR) repeat protein
MKTLTLANIHESQGYRDEAIKIYKDILAEDPENEAALLALQRLTKKRRSFLGVNQKKKYFFSRMSKKEQYIQFEKWLGAPWN